MPYSDKSKMRAYQAQFAKRKYWKDPEKARKTMREYLKKRYHADPVYRRRRIDYVAKGQGRGPVKDWSLERAIESAKRIYALAEGISNQKRFGIQRVEFAIPATRPESRHKPIEPILAGLAGEWGKGRYAE